MIRWHAVWLILCCCRCCCYGCHHQRAMMILHMSSKRSSITVRFTASFCFTFVRFLISMGQHMSISIIIKLTLNFHFEIFIFTKQRLREHIEIEKIEIRKSTYKWSCRLKALEHIPQTYFLSSLWVNLCFANADAFPKTLLQTWK